MGHRIGLVRYTIACTFIVFGALKLIPSASPAEQIGIETVQKITFYLFSETFCITALAIFEVLIGILLLWKRSIRIAVVMGITHLICTFTPFIFFPNEVFDVDVNSLSLLGQYIVKNIVIISALLLIYPSQKIYKSTII